MAVGGTGLMSRMLDARTTRGWDRAARRAADMDLADLARLRDHAAETKRHVDRTLLRAEERLALPMIGSAEVPRPAGADWSHRPATWREPAEPVGLVAPASGAGLGEGLTLFHDSAASEITVRQRRLTGSFDLAPFGLEIDVLGFGGSFLSLAVALPPEAAEGLRRSHIVAARMEIEVEHPVEIFARLNMRHGPNLEQMVREAPQEGGTALVEFYLGYSKVNDKRITDVWLDIIFDDPSYNRVCLRDLTLSRRPRAEM